MGKIHDALQRAEEQRTRLGGARGGPRSPEVLRTLPQQDPRPAKPRTSERDRGEDARAARRSRVITAGGSLVAEEYRTLRARIQSIRRTREIRSLVVTSAVPAEGKTTTAVNLSLCFGLDVGSTTCLVDADLRTPSVHHAFGDLPDIGLAELLQTDAKLEDALLKVPDTHLSVIPVRSLPNNPAELLASPKMTKLLEELCGRFDMVVLDAPPVLGLPDAVSLTDLCDAALFVVGAGGVSRKEAEIALDRLGPGRVIGTVFNRCESQESPYPYYYYHAARGEGA